MTTDTRWADLHLHTSHSDGADAPEEMVERAAGLGASCISITDHDTVSAYDKAGPVAEQRGVELIPGVEVSSSSGEDTVHILGYLIDMRSKALTTLMIGNREGRLERMDRIIVKLKRLGYDVSLDELLGYIGSRTVGRALLARYMVQQGHFPAVQAVFTSLLGDGKPAYEPVPRFRPEEAIELIAQAGGVSSLAHPGDTIDEKDIERYKEAGLDGIEVYTPQHDHDTERRCLAFARRFGLLVTGGSDSHGAHMAGRDIGSQRLPYRYVENLKQTATAAADAAG